MIHGVQNGDNGTTVISMRQKIFIGLTVIWMVIIFAFSARPAELSESDSMGVGAVIGRMFIPEFEKWTEQEQTEFAESIDHPVRKTAHASEYAVLGLLAAGAVIRKSADMKKGTGICRGIFIPWGIAVLYAASDEIHQLFVPGRSGQVTDVLIDSAGALAGLLILAVVRKARKNLKETSYEEN